MTYRSSEREPEAPDVTGEQVLRRLIVRMDTLQRDCQRQIDDLKERVRVLEEDAGIKTAIDWDRAFNAGPQGQG